MTCKHLRELEQALHNAGVTETYRGQPWTKNCREWIYFDCILDLKALRERFSFAPCVVDHEHRGTHDGNELGFYCSECFDGIMGAHPSQGTKKIFR